MDAPEDICVLVEDAYRVPPDPLWFLVESCFTLGHFARWNGGVKDVDVTCCTRQYVLLKFKIISRPHRIYDTSVSARVSHLKEN
jgi:hypothetical protein